MHTVVASSTAAMHACPALSPYYDIIPVYISGTHGAFVGTYAIHAIQVAPITQHRHGDNIPHRHCWEQRREEAQDAHAQPYTKRKI